MVLAALALTLLAGADTPAVAEEDYLRMVLETPAPTPYTVCRYEIVRRGRATSAVHRKRLAGYAESLQGIGLLTKEEEAAIWALAVDTKAAELPDAVDPMPAPGRPMPAPGRLTWRIELSRDGRAHAFRVTDPLQQPRREYARLFVGVKELVVRLAGEIPFRNVFFPAGNLGWLNIITVPAARVEIDGFDTRLESPLYGYEVASGEHVVRLRSLDGALDRQYKVRVEPSGTTQLRLDLR
jgi:hypothetical protein